MGSWHGSFEDTVSPRYPAIFAAFNHIKLWLETLDWTAADAAEQVEMHAWLDRLEAWVKEFDAWDQAMMEKGQVESFEQSFQHIMNTIVQHQREDVHE